MTQRADEIHVILASGSPYRKNQLDKLGLKFETISPQVDEDYFKKKFSHLDPKEICQILAKEKNLSISAKYPHSFIISSDQMVTINNEILDKPKSFKKAVEQLNKLQGNQHKLISSLYVNFGSRSYSHIETIDLKMKNLSQVQIENYVKLDNPLDCAGSYKIEKAGICLMEEINGKDWTTIEGLPILAVTKSFEIFLGQLPFNISNPIELA